MAFLIPDNLKSKQDVTVGIRKIANAFQVALEENVCVWYEPLFDPTDNKPDFVVMFPDRGIVVLEALDVSAHSLLGTLRGKIRIKRDGKEIETKNPLERANSLGKVLRERVNSEERLDDFKVTIACGAVFPALTREDAEKVGISSILQLDHCIFKSDLEAAIAGNGEYMLLRAFNRMFGGSTYETIPIEKEQILRGIIQPDIVIGKLKPSEEYQIQIFLPPDTEQDVIRVMDKKQEAMAKSIGDGHRVIRGVAGSGKTLVLVYRAKLLARCMPSKPILVTCYTRSLASQLRLLLQDYSNIDVVNLDRLMANCIRAANIQHPGYKDDGTGDKVAEIALKALNNNAKHYHAILIDEAQDFSTTTLQFALALLEPGYHDLLVVADAAQNIFKRTINWKQAGIKAQGRTRLLRVNYRNTKQILEFAYGFLMKCDEIKAEDVPDQDDENAVIPPESAARIGSLPAVHRCDNHQSEIDLTVDQVINWLGDKANPRSIAVLYASSETDGFTRARDLYYGLQSSDVEVFWLSDPENRDAREQFAYTEAPVILSTIHSAKGLEFSNVVLCGLWRENQDTISNRRLAYVGLTRAMDKLVVVVNENDPLAADLVN